MHTSLSQSTVDLVTSITRPLISSGALHKSEQQALAKILKEHTAGKNDASVKCDIRSVITPAAAASMLQVSKRTVMRMIAAKELDAVYLRKGSPKTLRIKLVSIDALLAESQVSK